MNLTAVSFAGLIILFLLGEVCGYVLKIRANSFYAFFHFTGGALVFLFLHSFLANYYVCLLLTELVGVLWEIYEWALWKYFLKKKLFKPERNDTRNDLILDFIGGTVMLILFRIFLS